MYTRVLLVTATAAGVVTLFSQINATALAGGTVCDSIGPDVVVGSITGPSNYSSSGGIEAFSIGTTSCNIGDEVLNWISNSTQHPVIGQNLFRLNNGRFEQIGQAWLKHGFAALQGNACGCGCIPANSSHLGVGCSDPYGSSLNGSQSGMGPKFEVNAYTGAFLWPPTDFSLTGNSIYKRLQAQISDLDPALNGGGTYVVEAQYVTPDDSAAGNQFNNVSYHPCTISGSGNSWTMSFTGTTVRESAAIEAWRLADPSVSIRTIDVPGDGRFLLGWKVTDLGGGQWDYEFALYNMNSDRSAGSFHVFVPNGTNISSTGFHDVDYHSGEPYDGTDWTATVFTDEVAWETQTFAQNPDANALRWGTLYNYRFVSDADPSTVTQAEIGLFKLGVPASILIDLTPDALANDNCANAIAVSTGTTAFTTINATTDGPDEPADCDFSGYTHLESDVWYRYTAPCTGDVTVSLCGSSYDTKLAIYGAACPVGPGESIACNDDFCALQSEVTFPASAGQQFLVRIGGFQGAQGDGTMTIDCGGIIEDNDLCANAVPISDGNIPFDTTAANTDGPAHPECQFDGQTYHDVWYDYTAACTGTLTVSTCNTATYDTDLVVYDGCDCANLALLACNDDASGCAGFTSEVIVPVVGGNCYKIRVGGWQSGDQGTGTLAVSCSGKPFTDCNGNGVNDATDIAKGTSADCNTNLVPDECDIAQGTSDDCAGGPVGVASAGGLLFSDNGCFACHAPDGSGGIGPNIQNHTRVQIWEQLLPPTTHPGGAFPQFTQQDFADLEAFLDTIGGSGGRPDLVPDECQTLSDCDNDGIADACELEAGTQVDLNFNGTPDACEPPCPADLNEDGVVGFEDLTILLTSWVAGTTQGDIGGAGGCDVPDGVTDFFDLSCLLAAWAAGGCN